MGYATAQGQKEVPHMFSGLTKIIQVGPDFGVQNLIPFNFSKPALLTKTDKYFF
jgi:hypothetical protein